MSSKYSAASRMLVVLAFAILTYAFVTQDFSVKYVAMNSNRLLPWYYRFSAVWGAHEGSLLLWVLILNVWTVAVATFTCIRAVVMVTVPPTASEPVGLHVTFVNVVVTAVQVPLVLVALTNVTPTGSVSVKKTFVAGIGPLL